MPLVWRQPQSYNLVFRCNIKSHTRGYFTTTNNLVDLWPLVKSGGLYKTVVSHLLKWDTIINKSIDPKHITGILSLPLCILNFKESLAFVNLEQIISELQAVEWLKAIGFFEAGQKNMIRDDTKIFTSWVVKRKTRTQYPQKSLVKPVVHLDVAASRHKPTEQHIQKKRYFTPKWLACTKTITWITAVFSGQSLTPRERNRSNGKNYSKTYSLQT